VTLLGAVAGLFYTVAGKRGVGAAQQAKEDEEARERAALGLPVAFGSSNQQPKKKKKKKRKNKKSHHKNSRSGSTSGRHTPSNGRIAWDDTRVYQNVADPATEGMNSFEMRDHHLAQFHRYYPHLTEKAQEKYHFPGPPPTAPASPIELPEKGPPNASNGTEPYLHHRPGKAVTLPGEQEPSEPATTDAALETVERTLAAVQKSVGSFLDTGLVVDRSKAKIIDPPSGSLTAYEALDHTLDSMERSLKMLSEKIASVKETKVAVLSQVAVEGCEGEEKHDPTVEEMKKQAAFEKRRAARIDNWAAYHYTQYLRCCSRVLAQFFKQKKVEQIPMHKIFMAEFNEEEMEEWRKVEPPNAQIPEKYWYQRQRLFTRFAEGIQLHYEKADGTLDVEGWYSATPESIAKEIAIRCGTGVVVDAMCGCGGNAIQFALNGAKRVVAIELDAKRLELCKNNARVYGVEDKIEFINGNAFEVLPTLTDVDCVFLAPPWGGMLYHEKYFDIRKMSVDGVEIFKVAQKVSRNIAYFLPRNVDKKQIVSLAGQDGLVELAKNVMFGKVKSITAYFGDLADKKRLAY